MKRFRFAALVLVCLALVGIGTIAQAQTEVTLSVWTHDQLYIDYFNTRLAEWEAMHPDITFTYDFQVIPNAWDAALTALAAGEALPDLLGIEQGGFPNYMKNGVIAQYFVDLTDLIPDPSLYAQGRMAIYTYEGKLYALESQLAAMVYYYQPKIFEDNGVEVPTTWEGMLAAGDVLGPKGIALSVATNDGNWFQMLVNQRGAELFDKDGNYVLGNETNRALAIEVADFIQKAVKNGTLFVVLGGDHWSGVTIPTAYREGRLAGQVMPDWWAPCCLQPGVEEMSGQWSATTPPVWEGGGYKTGVWGGTGFAVSSQSPNAALAKEFIGFVYLGKESQVLKFEAINNFPWMLEAYDDPRVTDAVSEFFSGVKLGELYRAVADGVPVWYQSPFRAAAGQAAVDNLPLLFDGTLTPEAFIDTLIRITQDAIDFG
jgi:ABC-type glycerol-3-phosphate transport system substrate-binding protein